MNKSESITNLVGALTAFQGKMTAVKKGATNPFFKSKYATLDTIWETIRKPLSENGLSITQTMNLVNDKSVLETTLYHTSGEWISGAQLVNPVKDDPQSLGSAISYARRYSLSALLGIVADEDDDGNVATKPELVKSTTTTAKDTAPRPKSETTAPTKAEPGISLAQTKKIYASAKEKGITQDQAKAYLKEVFHKMSTKELTISEASRLIEDINAGKLNKGGDNHLVEAALKLGAEIIEEKEN